MPTTDFLFIIIIFNADMPCYFYRAFEVKLERTFQPSINVKSHHELDATH